MATPQEQVTLGDLSLVVEDPLRDPRLTLPSVRRNSKSGMLEWQPAGEVQPNPNARGLLQKFVDLHGRHDFVIGEFAEKYGVLGLTRLGRIEGSRGTDGPEPDLIQWIESEGVFLERIAFWRPYIASLRYITACFTRLRVDTTTPPLQILEDEGFPAHLSEVGTISGSRELWTSFGLGEPDFSTPLARWMLADGPHTIADNLQRVGPENALKWLAAYVTSVWVPLGGIYVALASDGRRVQTVLRLGGIWAPGWNGIMPENSLRHVLVAQLLALATRPSPSELIACSNCGTFYEPLRTPSRGQAHYCPTCRPIIARQQKRQWAARNRAANRRSNDDE
jgi:hypothetical protein